jgi:predicted DNA-binding protein YlxM (UPF0122 family)
MKNIDTIHKDYNNIVNENKKKRILNSDFNELSWDNKRLYLLYESNHTCQKCDLSEWMGQKLSFEIDHIDGDRLNNNRNNLIVLCPNCHCLTKTWRGKNKNYKRFKINDTEILTLLLKNNWNIRKTLIELNLSPKGGNYKRCHKIRDNYEEMGYTPESKVLNIIDDKLFNKYYNELLSYKEIALKLDVSYKRIMRYIKDNAIKKRRREYPKLEELIEKYKLFGSMKKLASFYDMSDNGVRKWFVKHGVDPKRIKEII